MLYILISHARVTNIQLCWRYSTQAYGASWTPFLVPCPPEHVLQCQWWGCKDSIRLGVRESMQWPDPHVWSLFTYNFFYHCGFIIVSLLCFCGVECRSFQFCEEPFIESAASSKIWEICIYKFLSWALWSASQWMTKLMQSFLVCLGLDWWRLIMFSQDPIWPQQPGSWYQLHTLWLSQPRIAMPSLCLMEVV